MAVGGVMGGGVGADDWGRIAVSMEGKKKKKRGEQYPGS